MLSRQYGLQRTVHSTSPPISLADVKNQLRIEHDFEDAFLRYSLIPAAVEYVEARTSRQLAPATWRFTVSEFKNPIPIPLPPLRSVDSIRYVDPDDFVQDLDLSLVKVWQQEPAIVGLIHGQAWPATLAVSNAIIITYQAGYDQLPGLLHAAVLTAVDDLYSQRDLAGDMTLQTLLNAASVGDEFEQYGGRPQCFFSDRSVAIGSSDSGDSIVSSESSDPVVIVDGE